MYSLCIYSVKERRPENGESIIRINCNDFYESYELQPTTIEYLWLGEEDLYIKASDMEDILDVADNLRAKESNAT